MTTATGDDDRATDDDRTTDDTDLAAAVHHVLAALTHVRRGPAVSPDQLRDRIELVRWLRRELDDVEALLAGVRDRASTPPPAG
jgi:hypothetical protein